MRSVFTRVSDEEFEFIEKFAREHKLSIYEAVRELIRIGISEYRFKSTLLSIVELMIKLDRDFKFKLEKLISEFEEL